MGLPLSSEQVPDRDVADHDAALSEFVGQGSNRKVWLIGDAAQQPIALRLEDRPAMTADLARSNSARCSIDRRAFKWNREGFSNRGKS